MKSRVYIIILLFCFMSIFMPLATAAEETAMEKNDIKQSIVFIYSNNMGKTDLSQSYQKDIKTDIQNRFLKTFESNYNVIPGDDYLKKMNDAGMTDLSTAERTDILEYFKDSGAAYIVIFETLPMNKENNSFGLVVDMSITSFSHLKFIDVKQNKYLFNGKFSYRTKWGSPFGCYTKNYQDAEEQVLIPKLLSKPNSSPSH
ncbi:MAG: hypothetical protein P4N59_04850 [Negativicutes bacterium]|nr:hypothetical protein [Negativicutes bacterium]